MNPIDWGVFALYFGGVVAFAWFQSRKNEGVEGYFLANRRLPWAAVGLSVMATQASAITFIGTTGQAFDEGMEFIQIYLPQPLVMVLLCVLFVPFFYRAKVFTAYEYLENRFDPKTRSLTSFLFLVSRGLAAGLVLYAPAIVLSVIMGWDETVTILVMAAVTIAYTLMGGITAVIWTDVIQMLMMFVGIGVALFILFTTLPSGVTVTDVAYIGGIQEMWTSIDWSWDPSNRYTIWSGMIGGFFLALAYFGTDQSQVQRYLTASSLKQSRLSLIFNAFVKVPMQFFILSIGVLLFVFYHFEQPPLVFNNAEVQVVMESERAEDYQALEVAQSAVHGERRASTLELLDARHSGDMARIADLQSTISGQDERLVELRQEAKAIVSEVRGASSNDVNYVFPSYIVKYIPAGVLGLLIAVIFAAAMSSLDSELTALSSATVIDFYKRWFREDASDAHYLLVSKISTFIWGVLACFVALYAGQLGSLIEAVNEVGSYFYGSLLGVFLLAFLWKPANGHGAFWGLVAGMGSVFGLSLVTEIAYLWFNVIGTVAVLAVGIAVSAFTGGRDGGRASPA
ncbi:MAG: sodium:solute symporter [Gemmatimonadales bacterium]|jgi:SSS family transporter|nr:MAG: sodium:solute symporter [Gemmatimonadales bacterium]